MHCLSGSVLFLLVDKISSNRGNMHGMVRKSKRSLDNESMMEGEWVELTLIP